MEVFNNTFEAEFEGYTPVADGDSIVEVTLPQEWYEINKKLEDDHQIMGGLVYKDMDGIIKVTPLVPPYGIREDECGVAKSALAMYNSKQQLLVKPATDGRHAVSLQQLDKFFGGTDSTSEKTYSIKRVPPVDTSLPIEDREPYLFCRDSENNFAGKHYSGKILPQVIVERDKNGDISVNTPKSSLHPVNLGYMNSVLEGYVKIGYMNSVLEGYTKKAEYVFENKYVDATPSKNTFGTLENGKSYTAIFYDKGGNEQYTNTVVFDSAERYARFSLNGQTLNYDNELKRWQFDSVNPSAFTRIVSLQVHNDANAIMEWVKKYVADAIAAIPNARGVGF